MAPLPIRSIIARALDKEKRLENFIALPVLFESEYSWIDDRPKAKENLPHNLGDAKVAAIWHTPQTIEIDLSNGLRVSIQISPPTLAMKITRQLEIRDSVFVPLTLIRHDEEANQTAQTIELRIRAVRQMYAIAVIALDSERYVNGFKDVNLSGDVDFESYLDEVDRLILHSAGEGSFWAVFGVAWKAAKQAPKTAFIVVTTVLKGGADRAGKYADAIVQEKQAAADINSFEAESIRIQNKAAQIQLNESENRAKIETGRQAFAAQKEKMDSFRELVDWIDKVQDLDVRAKMKEELEKSSLSLLGPITAHWLEQPPQE